MRLFGKNKSGEDSIDELDLYEEDYEEIEEEEFEEVYEGEYTEDDEYYQDEEGNLYSKEDYALNNDGELYYIDDFYQDGEGNLYSKEEYTIGNDGMLYEMEEEEEFAFEEYDEESEEAEDEYKATFLKRVKDKLFDLHPMDFAIGITGLMVIVVGILAGMTWLQAESVEDQVATIATIGEELSGISIVGESQLLALKEAYIMRVNGQGSSSMELQDIDVVVNFTSVEKDLKIKFSNNTTKALISGILFQVELTDEQGNKTTITDEDKDGIIYEIDMTPGSYQVRCLNVGDFEFPQTTTEVIVKDKISYEKIYIADEVKTEADVDVTVEDAHKDTVETEAQLKDTVEFVESSKTTISGDGAYAEVSKSTIADPSTVAGRIGAFIAMSASDNALEEEEEEVTYSVTLNKSSTSLTVGNSETLTTTLSPSGSTVTWTSNNTNIATVSSGKITAVAAGSATITASISDGTSDGAKIATCAVTVSAVSTSSNVTSISINPSAESVTLKAGDTYQVTATVSGESGYEDGYSWSSDSVNVTVNTETGLITAVQATTTPAKVTVTTKGVNASGSSLTKTIEVTVSSNTSISLDNATLSLLTGNTQKLTASVQNLSDQTVVFSSSDSAVATVASDGTVTGVSVGTAVITATATDGTNATCAVTIIANASLDTTTKLKDINGMQVYVKENNTYREAVYADYYTSSNFYIKSGEEYFYTGWQTISNITYYYDKNGVRITGEQVIQGVKYMFASDGALSIGTGTLGIDVSKWNGTINWTAVKNSGVSYVIIRCGYRGYTSGTLIEDPNFKANIEGAIAAGIKVGVYIYSQAINEVEAVQEASMVLDMVSNYRITYPLFIDIEYSGGRADSISNSQRTAVAKAFCETIQNSGYTAGVYANKDWLTNKMDASQLNAYKIWLAQYNTQVTYSGRYDMWQYTDNGTVGGISGNVDLNESYLGY
ncbi:MAG: GH25 family lysozyme [Eubacteriales bacterium]